MTSNMINYRKLEEDRRHNREMERLTGESQAETARHQQAVEEETYRTNVANEAIKTQQNVINDNHYSRTDAETKRHNLMQETQYPSEIALNEAKTNESKASAYDKSTSALERMQNIRESQQRVKQSIAQTALINKQAKESAAKTLNLMHDIELKTSQELLNYAKVTESTTKSAYNTAAAKTQGSTQLKNYSSVVRDILGSSKGFLSLLAE